MNILDRLEELGKDVEARWGKVSFAKETFPGIAADALKESAIHNLFGLEEFVRALWSRQGLPVQFALENTFGQPPVTCYSNQERGFLVDLYFWVTPDISIHSHGFRGAFTVLHGKSLHCQYAFETREPLGEDALVGDLRLQKSSFLKPGDIQEILPGEAFIHQVWHIGFPTVSLAIRTFNEGLLQYSYCKPHLAFVFNKESVPLQKKKRDTFFMLHQIQHPLEEELLEDLLLTTGFSLGLFYFLAHRTEDEALERTRRLLEKLPSFRRWVPEILESLKQGKEERADWSRLRNEDERFLLAVLSSCSKRSDILNLVSAYASEGAPEANLLKWLKGLLRHKKVDFRLNKTALDVLGLLLCGNGEPQICEALCKKYAVDNSEAFQNDIHTFLEQLHAVELLKPLLSDPAPSASALVV